MKNVKHTHKEGLTVGYINNELTVIDERELLGKQFRMYGSYENPLFLAKDVAEWIEHQHITKMLNGIDEEEKLIEQIVHAGQRREMWFLTEDGFYEVLMQSRKPIAKQFKKEVKLILKQIRKTGGYIAVKEDDDETSIMARALMIAQNTLNKKDELLKAKDKEIEVLSEDLNQKNRFINQLAASENSLLVREVAKIASKADVVIGEKRLWSKLREWGLIFKNSTEPKQCGVDRGYFEVNEGTKESKGKVFTYRTTRVTGKGQAYIIDRLVKEGV
ncbi:phage antirepressor KilAC domain-containing protein [Clostridium celatum]|uniref:phage antirepressor n=1 Tax=Clostridium celatum TaxID=36834 RepID=UPI00290B9127|nr:phage antirepressor KilAC domain-containing protein [Clostridium celatum]MDU6296051.1 phage antirepressor KilAC domain-containing protein [Clostridium celatum]